MYLLAKTLHRQGHIGINKLKNYCATSFHGIKRKIMRKVMSDCETCKLELPLKATDEFRHITAGVPHERFQIDLIDLKPFSNEKITINGILHPLMYTPNSVSLDHYTVKVGKKFQTHQKMSSMSTEYASCYNQIIKDLCSRLSIE
eukprot:GHVP01059426.1.p1 GENE.GHVP01059426.1~~GHVP01059426.1.p1  ORF type:complete len:145 (+),score=13.39 GHVP01059426.1:416-850(+)